MAASDFKVVIVGAGVTGLALANMLEMAGINYVVLEARDKVAPQEGAGIGMFPNGLRILDQMGLFETIRDAWHHHSMTSAIRAPSGKLLGFSPGVGDHLEKRHGYPFIFINRQLLLQIMFDNLKNKQNVRTGRKVTEVSINDHGVEVVTADGQSTAGSVLVGADGIHSRVRNEMWRIGNEKQPGAFLEDQGLPVTSQYKCVFGITYRDKVFDSNHFVCGDGHCYLISPGGTNDNNAIYWFLFVRNGSEAEGAEMPRYTKQDEEDLVKKHFYDPITESTTFGDLYRDCKYSCLTPLAEHVFKRWYFERIITLGDAAHKHNPIGGQGGMTAIEAAAAFVNGITPGAKDPTHTFTNDELNRIFSQVQNVLEKRVKTIVKGANTQVKMLSNNHKLSPLMPYVVSAFGGTDSDLWRLERRVAGGLQLQHSPMPRRSRVSPFNDELPAKRLRTSPLYTMLFAAVALVPLVLGGDVFSLGGWLDWSLIDYWTLVLPTIAIWAIDGYRQGHQSAITRWPIVFGIIWQRKGIEWAVPIYFALRILTDENTIVSRPVPSYVTKSLIPTLALCAVLPTGILSSLPYVNGIPFSSMVQAAPVCIPAIVAVVSTVSKRTANKPKGKDEDAAFDQYTKKDIAVLKKTYLFLAILPRLAQLLIVILFFTPLSITDILPPSLTVIPFYSESNVMTAGTSLLAFGGYTIFDLRRQGYLATLHALGVAFLFAAGLITLGPGLAYPALWFWREDLLSKLGIE